MSRAAETTEDCTYRHSCKGKVKVAKTIDATHPLIRERTPFRTAIRKTSYGTFISMSGHAHEPMAPRELGHLPHQYREHVRMAEFVVYSYDTPIAWWSRVPRDTHDLEYVEAWLRGDEGQWFMPQVRYTTTTTQHFSEVHTALGGYGSHRTSWQRENQIPYVSLRYDDAPERVEQVGCERHYY